MKKKIFILFLIILFFEIKTFAGYIQKINLEVIGEIAKPIFIVDHDDVVNGNFSNINEIPYYTFEVKNYNDERISEINFNIKIEVISNIDFEIIDCNTNEIILNKDKNSFEIFAEKEKNFNNKYKILLKTDKQIVKENLKIVIDAKYFKYELKAFEINIDKRDLEYEVSSISDSNSKYTNKDITIKIKCNKEVKNLEGFELSSDKTILTKSYQENTIEELELEDYYNNRKKVKIAITNIDKTPPEIVGIEDGKIYSKGLKLIYKDNIGVKNIIIENTLTKNTYTVDFDIENKIIDNQILVVNNNSINPYYLNLEGSYKITVTDFAENKTVKHISIK